MNVNLNGSFLKNVTTPLEELGPGVHLRDSRNIPWDSPLYSRPVPVKMAGPAHSASLVFFILSEKCERKDTSICKAPTQHFSVISPFNSFKFPCE